MVSHKHKTQYHKHKKYVGSDKHPKKHALSKFEKLAQNYCCWPDPLDIQKKKTETMSRMYSFKMLVISHVRRRLDLADHNVGDLAPHSVGQPHLLTPDPVLTPHPAAHLPSNFWQAVCVLILSVLCLDTNMTRNRMRVAIQSVCVPKILAL